MWKVLFVLCDLLLTLSVFAQQRDIYSFIPANYDTLFEGVAKGDLNKDGIEDAVLAVYPNWENDSDWMQKTDENLPERLLIILFGTRSGYSEVAISSKAIMCKSCGGVFGDPFEGISIEKNILKVYHYGGSSWRWSYTHKFRFQSGTFYLIGKTDLSYWCVVNCDKLNDFAGTNYKDINFITGDYEEKEISEDCKLLKNKKGRQKISPLIPLSKFDIDN